MLITELLTQFADPEIIQTLSASEKFTAGLVATILGMGITFTALIILQFVIILMEKLIKQPIKNQPEQLQSATPAISCPEPCSPIDSELIAVVSSVLALQLKTQANNIVIRKIERINTPISAWSRAGIMKQMNTRL